MPKIKKNTKKKEKIKKIKPVDLISDTVAEQPQKPPEVMQDTIFDVKTNDVIELNDKGERIEKYYEAIGRRKESTARVRVLTKKSTDLQVKENKGIIIINDKPYYEYFNSEMLQEIVDAPLKKLKSLNRFKATVKVKGGGIHGQADAIKFGLSRALVLFDPNFAKKLRKAGYLTRDSREKERRKYGLKKARKSPQWSKR